MSSNINHNNNHDPYINRVIFSKYLVLKKIGKGSFGIVYSGRRRYTKNILLRKQSNTQYFNSRTFRTFIRRHI